MSIDTRKGAVFERVGLIFGQNNHIKALNFLVYIKRFEVGNSLCKFSSFNDFLIFLSPFAIMVFIS